YLPPLSLPTKIGVFLCVEPTSSKPITQTTIRPRPPSHLHLHRPTTPAPECSRFLPYEITTRRTKLHAASYPPTIAPSSALIGIPVFDLHSEVVLLAAMRFVQLDDVWSDRHYVGSSAIGVRHTCLRFGHNAENPHSPLNHSIFCILLTFCASTGMWKSIHMLPITSRRVELIERFKSANKGVARIFKKCAAGGTELPTTPPETDSPTAVSSPYKSKVRSRSRSRLRSGSFSFSSARKFKNAQPALPVMCSHPDKGSNIPAPHSLTTLHFTLDDFSAFLLGADNSTFEDREHDMTRPLPEYYISSSHNTHLVGHQLVANQRSKGTSVRSARAAEASKSTFGTETTNRSSPTNAHSLARSRSTSRKRLPNTGLWRL
ncbi:unnamed protein product, partial [Rhizoctonia solani]